MSCRRPASGLRSARRPAASGPGGRRSTGPRPRCDSAASTYGSLPPADRRAATRAAAGRCPENPAYDRGMVRVLAVSDDVDEGLYADPGAARDAGLILACGDLPFDYLDYLMNALDVPLVFVPGNHDPDVSGYRVARSGLTLRAGLPASPPWPGGAACADGRIVDAAGLRV